MKTHMPTAAPQSRSLRRQLLVILLSGLALIWLTMTVVTLMATRHEIDELLDAHLAQSASLLLSQVGEDVDEIELEHAPALGRHAQDVAFQIWDRKGRLQLHSRNAPAQPLSAVHSGYDITRLDGQSWRVFSAMSADHRYRVQVGESMATRQALTMEMLLNLLAPLLLAIPVVGALVWLAVARSLRPVDALGASLAQLQPGEPVPTTSGIPRELLPLVVRLKQLLARVNVSLDSERRFTSDASHELRTPLAAVRTQLQVAQGARDTGERDHAIAMAMAASDRATRLIEQLLTLARVDHQALQETARTVCLHDLVQQVTGMLAPDAARKHLELVLDADADCRHASVQGHAELLVILLRNLIDNAIRYTRPDSTVTVRLERGPGHIINLSVCDEGPGIPPALREAALQRFRRLDDGSRDGSGLGLSIASRIAELHGSALMLGAGPNDKGLCVQLQLPIRQHI